jgi:capsular polysaccharide transport system permease protein
MRARGLDLCRRRRFGQAAAVFGTWAATDGTAAPALLQARAFLLAKDRARAREACLRALALDPTLVRGHRLLATIARDRGNGGQVLVHLRDALKLCPEAASLRARMAALMLERGQVDGAARLARQALQRDAGCGSARLVLAACEGVQGVRGTPGAVALASDAPGGAGPQEPDRAAPATGVPAGAAMAAARAAPPAHPPATPGGPASPAPSAHRSRAAQRQPRSRPARPWVGLEDLFVIRALVLRNLQLKYHGNRFGLLQELIRPVTVIFAHWLLFTVLRKPMPGEIPVAAFVLAGFSVWFAFNYTVQGAAGGAKWPGGATALPGVTAMHLRLARAAWPLLVNLVFCLTALLPFKAFGADLPLPDLPRTALVFLVAGAMGVGFGLLTERLGTVWSIVRPLEKLTVWALFVTCGLYFVVDRVPPVLAALFLYNPLLHLVELERHAFDPGYPVMMIDSGYPGCVAGVLLVLGLAACRSIRDASPG